MKQKLLAVIAVIFLLALPSVSFAQQDYDQAFNPNKLVDDGVFSDTQTFTGPEGIQKFLESKGSILADTSSAFLAKLKEPNISILKQALNDPHPNSTHLRSAAELIWDAAQETGLNPQVILVTLNKEQSLVTGHQGDSADQVQRALDFAMGFDCPDSSGCGNLFPGFYFQLFGNLDASGNRYLGSAASLMKSFNTPGGRGPAVNGSAAKVGDTIVLSNTLGGYNGVQAQQSVYLSNAATAALYRYTPHVFNGNYNFWKFFNAWFRFPNGTLLKGRDRKVYIIQNGEKMQLPAFVAQARGLNLAGAQSVTQAELDSYPTDDKPYGPADNTIISVDGKLYVFLDNVKHPASAFVIGQRGLNATNAITVSSSDASIFADGSQLTPADGTVLKGDASAAIYLIQAGSLQLFSPFTFAQHKAAAQVKIMPQAELDTYPKNGFVPPLDGTLIKSTASPAVYLVQQGAKHPLTAELFRNHGYTFAGIAVISGAEVDGLPTGAFATPVDSTWFKAGTAYYFYKEGAKHYISAFVAAQKHITPDYSFEPTVASQWPDGAPLAPRDGTIIKGDKSPAVFLVQNGQLRPLTFAAFQARKITPKQISVLSQGEVDAYAKGDVLAK